MKNSKVSFVLNLCISIGFLFNSCGLSNKKLIHESVQIIQYSSNPSCHSRAISASEEELVIATSDGNVYFYPKETKEIYTLFSSKNKDYRDLAFDEKKILLLAVGDSSFTTSYKVQSNKLYKTPFDGLFLDGMDYSGNTVFIMGDPINNTFSLFKSENWGESWERIKNSPAAYKGEAGFAASGSNVKVLNQNIFTFVSGGDSSRYFRTENGGESWYSKSMGFNSCPTCGAYSFVTFKRNLIIAVGGDYLNPDESIGTCRISKDGGKTWISPKINPNGYRSNITEINGIFYCCGTNGIDFSKNKGKKWKPFSQGNYFTLCEFDGKLAASTVNGTIHLFNLNK